MKTKTTKVLVYLPAYVKSNRDLLRGVLRYASRVGLWDCEVIGVSEEYEKTADDEMSSLDGVVCYADDTALARRLLALNIPALAIYPDGPPRKSPSRSSAPRADVVCGSGHVGVTAARFLDGLAPASFAFAGRIPATRWSRARRRTFTAELAARGHVPELIGVGRRGSLTALTRKLAVMPHPVALFAENDLLARNVLSACRDAKLAVPQDVIILGVDDDEILCETITPSITSIRMDALECGYRAAKALDQMMAGNPPSETLLDYTSANITERLSTATEFNFGVLADRARAFIAKRLDVESEEGPLKVDEICTRLGVSRRTLEINFKKETGRTLHDEIVRLRTRKAMKLLENGSLTLEAIAESCGFSSTSHLGRVFRKEFGIPPSKARERLALYGEKTSATQKPKRMAPSVHSAV